MDVNGVTDVLRSGASGEGGASSATQGLGSQDFLKLLITQLTNQDPLEPTDNDELLRQISSIREIELSTTLTDSLRSLTDQQRFASASTLIGQYVTSLPGEDGATHQGIVVGVRFSEAGRALIQLSDGSEMPLERVQTIRSPQQAAQALVGVHVVGLDRREAGDPRPVEGVVTSVRSHDADGELVLELDTGDSLRLRDVLRIGEPATA